jgi:hypothetical protein
MIFPVRKNLQIGFGLVNTVTEQELKAILAHEFGHFSQRTMSVGSYVYNVNQVIFNMLYDNESFDSMIQAWANVTGYFSIFVIIAVKIINGIQWILQKMYGFVNLRYMALSREMEFHADEVAANIAGSRPLEESLLRLDMANSAYNLVARFYDLKTEKDIISKNIYNDQSTTLAILAAENNLQLKNGLPTVSLSDINKYNKSKINIEDQWASHPTTEERVKALQNLNIVKAEDKNNPAMRLFPNGEVIGEKFTKKVFHNIVYRGTGTVLDTEEYRIEFRKEMVNNRFPTVYNDYYDNKKVIQFDVVNITDTESTDTMDTLFGKDKVNLIYDFTALESDKNILSAIAKKEIAVKTFDYDGVRYKWKQAGELIDNIDRELKDKETEIEANDVNIYKFFYSLASKKGNGEKLKEEYIKLFDHDSKYKKGEELFSTFANSLSFLRVVTPSEQIEKNFRDIYQLEIKLKAEIKTLLENPALEEDMTKPVKDNLERYLAGSSTYYSNDLYDEDQLNIFIGALNDFGGLASRAYFYSKRSLLNYQAELLEE